jgi:hypothetical protein
VNRGCWRGGLAFPHLRRTPGVAGALVTLRADGYEISIAIIGILLLIGIVNGKQLPKKKRS